MIRERDRDRARTMLNEGRSWQEIEAAIPGVDLNELDHPTEEDQLIVSLGKRVTHDYVKGRLLRIVDDPETAVATRIDILTKLLART